MENIIVASITGGLAFLGVYVTNRSATSRMETSVHTAQAVTDTKLEALTEEVRKHNNFAMRMPVVEEQIKVINHRVRDLEDKE